MNETFVEISSVMVDMSTKRIIHTVGDHINDGRNIKDGHIKKMWLASPGEFMCIKMLIETKSGERDFARFIKLESIESIEVLYV